MLALEVRRFWPRLTGRAHAVECAAFLPPPTPLPHGSALHSHIIRARRRNPRHRLRHLLVGRLRRDRRDRKVGYRHIDTAWKYGTERGVGEGMRVSGVPRSEIFLTTKVSHEFLRADDFARSVDESLKTLGVDFVDLLLVHWPNPEIPLSEPIPALARAKRQGLTRHIGVANFNIAMLDEAIRLCPEPLVNLQAEYHAHLDQTKLIEACRRRGLIFTAYCPLGRGRLLRDPVLANIAARKGRPLAQIALRWLVQQGNIIPIPRSSNPARMAENLGVFDFALSEEEMKRIATLKRPDGRIADPAGRAPAWD
jgi:2,5-diketo-D-gluconate reductase B